MVLMQILESGCTLLVLVERINVTSDLSVDGDTVIGRSRLSIQIEKLRFVCRLVKFASGGSTIVRG
jgi:hypothetical protein